jgi:hypothetical protein
MFRAPTIESSERISVMFRPRYLRWADRGYELLKDSHFRSSNNSPQAELKTAQERRLQLEKPNYQTRKYSKSRYILILKSSRQIWTMKNLDFSATSPTKGISSSKDF